LYIWTLALGSVCECECDCVCVDVFVCVGASFGLCVCLICALQMAVLETTV